MSLLKRALQVLGSKTNNSPDHNRVRRPASPIVLEFDVLPDGKYLASFVSEQINEGNYIIAVFQITEGEFRDKQVPQIFDTKAAKMISREYTGMWVSRLAFEGNKKAEALENALLNSDGEFIIVVRDGHVSSIPEPDYDKMERLRKKVNKVS